MTCEHAFLCLYLSYQNRNINLHDYEKAKNSTRKIDLDRRRIMECSWYGYNGVQLNGVGIMETRFNTVEEAQNYLIAKGKQSGYFFNNVYGWSTYLTLKPTWCTPSGKHKKIDGRQPFPRRIKITIE